MDPALIPPTAAGRQLAWLMSLRAEPSAEEIHDHLEPIAAGEVHADFPGWAAGNRGLASGLLAFGTLVRELPGAVTQSEEALLRLELAQGSQVLSGMVSIGHQGSGKIGLFRLKGRPAQNKVEVDRIRLLYDRMAGTYEQLDAQVHYCLGCSCSQPRR